jgi:predicted  nucleic acid-binding Zn-ribbon protein
MMGSFMSGIFADLQMIGTGEQVMELFRQGRYVEANQLAVGALEKRIAGDTSKVDAEDRARARTEALLGRPVQLLPGVKSHKCQACGGDFFKKDSGKAIAACPNCGSFRTELTAGDAGQPHALPARASMALAPLEGKRVRGQIAYETYYRKAIHAGLAPLWDGLDHEPAFSDEKERWHEVVEALEAESVEGSR